MNKGKETWAKYIEIAWHLVLLLVVLARLGYGAVQGVDINLGDDARYMANGILHFKKLALARPNVEWAAWGPLYQFWFWLLWQWYADPIYIYYITILNIAILLPLLLYLIIHLHLNVKAMWAFVIAWIYALGYVNWWVEPRVTLFAITFLLSSWFLIGGLQEWNARGWAFAITAIFVSYIRPEFWIDFYLFLLFMFIYLFHQKGSFRERIYHYRKTYLLLSILTVFSLFVVKSWGVPLQKSRFIYAFGQHYARNVNRCRFAPQIENAPWEAYLERDFGHPENLFDLITANPRNFGAHILCNLKLWVLQMGRVFLFHLPWFKKGVRIYEAIALGFILLFIAVKRGKYAKTLRQRFEHPWIWVVFLWSVPILISTIIIWPREHYLGQLVPFIWIAYAILFVPRDDNQRTHQKYFTFILPLLLVLLTPPFHYFYPQQRGQQPRLESALIVRALPWTSPPGIAGTRGSGFYRLPTYLLPREARPLRPKHHQETFLEFLKNTRPDVLIVSRGGIEYKWDPGWQEFMVEPEQFGYYQIQLLSGDAFGVWRLFVRK